MDSRIPVLMLAFRVAMAAADLATAPPLPHPDPRYKADALIVVAHPDDDTAISGYLARAALDGRKRFAVIYCTDGDGGGNAKGSESSRALGQMRQIEARRSLQDFGIENVWFLSAPDTPGQNVLRSLENWGHGRVLDQVVRIVRLTRPEVVLTFLPQYVFGENHGDHQAAGVVATEAFDIAADPTQFPEQVTPARDPRGILNLAEGLQPWQPKKVYYFTDAFESFTVYWHEKDDASPFRKNMMDDQGPEYANTDNSPSRRESYARIAARHLSIYETQEGALGRKALAANDFSEFQYPTRFVFGKSVVGGSVSGDIFENITPQPAPFARTQGYEQRSREGLSLELGGPWMYYREFWRAHNLGRVAALIPVAECAAEFGGWLHLPLVLRNDTDKPREVTLRAVLPPGWTDKSPYRRFRVEPGSVYPVSTYGVAPATGKKGWQEVQWIADEGGRPVGSIAVRVYVGRTGGLPQY